MEKALSKGHKNELSHSASFGMIGRREWAFVGTKCELIRDLAQQIINGCAGLAAFGYLDATHDEKDRSARLVEGCDIDLLSSTDALNIRIGPEVNRHLFNDSFSRVEYVLVNGNHFPASSQVVFLDPAKMSSLRKRTDQLTNVVLFVVVAGDGEVFDFLKESVNNWQLIPLLHYDETAALINFFKKYITVNTPRLNGLVLAGGQSSRMGADKTLMNWHGKEQRYHLADMLQDFCQDVYISCRQDQEHTVQPDYKTLSDRFLGMGPLSGILSAFAACPDAAWLVVATDLPLLGEETLRFLVSQRAPRFLATAFRSPHDAMPDPLLTIWEPKSYGALLSFVARGYTCPRKVLMNTPVHIIDPVLPDQLMNVNTPVEAATVVKLLKK